VAAMNATFAVCAVVMLAALAVSIMRGGRRIEAATLG
jgi:hypothetical protein